MSSNNKPEAKRRSSRSINDKKPVTRLRKVTLVVQNPRSKEGSIKEEKINTTVEAKDINAADDMSTGYSKSTASTDEKLRQHTPVSVAIPAVFPLHITKKELKLSLSDASTIFVYDRKKDLLQFTIPATYRNVNVLCTSSVVRQSILLTVKQEQHIRLMSEELSPCRNMCTLLGDFKAYLHELKLDLRTLLKDDAEEDYLRRMPPLHFFVTKHYRNGTLRQYLNSRRRKGLKMEPFYFLQMAICLFSMLVDAHTMNIGLVDISLDSLYVATDGGLYFSGYRSCLALSRAWSEIDGSADDDSDVYYEWINPSSIKCPESQLLKTGYMKGTDVFRASTVLLKLIQKPDSRAEDVFRIERKTKEVVILRDNLDTQTFKDILPLLEEGLRYEHEERSTAKELLYGFETIRSKSLSAHTAMSD